MSTTGPGTVRWYELLAALVLGFQATWLWYLAPPAMSMFGDVSPFGLAWRLFAVLLVVLAVLALRTVVAASARPWRRLAVVAAIAVGPMLAAASGVESLVGFIDEVRWAAEVSPPPAPVLVRGAPGDWTEYRPLAERPIRGPGPGAFASSIVGPLAASAVILSLAWRARPGSPGVR